MSLRFDCLRLLVEQEADINALDFNGHTALYRTLKVAGNSVQLNLKAAQFLVDKDVNLQGRGKGADSFNENGQSN